jgi:hypothetical protein
MLVVAALGLLRLWLLQRKEKKADWRDIDGIIESLERISNQPPPQATRPSRAERPRGERKRVSAVRRAVGPAGGMTPLEPERRAAAIQRIEARRAARARAAG